MSARAEVIAVLQVPRCEWDTEAQTFTFPGLITVTVDSDSAVHAEDEDGEVNLFDDSDASNIILMLVMEVLEGD